jgi:hypothetical protein
VVKESKKLHDLVKQLKDAKLNRKTVRTVPARLVTDEDKKSFLKDDPIVSSSPK